MTLDYILPCCYADYFNMSSLNGLLQEVLPDIIKKRDRYLNSEATFLERAHCPLCWITCCMSHDCYHIRLNA